MNTLFKGDKQSTTAERLKLIMAERDMRQIDIIHACKPYAEKYHVKIGSNNISQYISGSVIPGQTKIFILAKALNVSEAWLMGYDVSPHRNDVPEPSYESLGLMRINTKKFPLLGEIACGKPIFASEDRESYVISGTDINADFCLLARGDSMIGARIHDGDIVFIKKADIVNNGEIAAVIIEDEATLKRVYYYPEKGKLVLNAENPQYEPLVYVGEELNQIHILGKAVAFQSDVK